MSMVRVMWQESGLAWAAAVWLNTVLWQKGFSFQYTQQNTRMWYTQLPT